MKLSEMRSPQVADAVRNNALVLVPVGQTEQHGPHLPINTDAVIASEVALRIAEELADEVPTAVADTICYGYSVKAVARWPGTFRLPPQTVMDTVFHTCKSLADMGFRKIAILDAHGNHLGLLRVVSRKLADELELDVPALSIGALAAESLVAHAEGGEGASCHAGELETSLMLHLRPRLVRTDLYPTEDRMRVPNPAGSAVFWSTWQRQKSQSGIYGDPSTASAGCITPIQAPERAAALAHSRRLRAPEGTRGRTPWRHLPCWRCGSIHWPGVPCRRCGCTPRRGSLSGGT